MKHNIVKFDKAFMASADSEAVAKKIDTAIMRLIGESEKKTERGNLTNGALVAMKKLDDYLEEQMEMFRSRGMPRWRALKEALVPTGEVTPSGVEMMKIVKRGLSLEPADIDDDGATVKANLLKFGDGIVSVKRGKYNDAEIIDMINCCGEVSSGEVMGGCVD